MNDPQITEYAERYAAAVYARDTDALLRLYDAEVTVFDLWAVWVQEGSTTWGRSVEDWFSSLGDQRVIVDFDEVTVESGENLATLHAIITYRDVGGDGVVQQSMQNRLTWVFRRTIDGWKIVHEHTSAPVDFDTQQVVLQRS